MGAPESSAYLDQPKAIEVQTMKGGRKKKPPGGQFFDPGFPAEIPVTATYMADHINVPVQRITELGRSGELPRNERGMYPLRSANRAYMEWFRSEARRMNKGELAQQVAVAKAKHLQLDLLRKEGQVADLQEVIDRYTQAAAHLKALVMAVPAQLSRDLQQRKRMEDALNAAFDQAVQSLTKMDEDPSSHLEDLEVGS